MRKVFQFLSNIKCIINQAEFIYFQCCVNGPYGTVEFCVNLQCMYVRLISSHRNLFYSLIFMNLRNETHHYGTFKFD